MGVISGAELKKKGNDETQNSDNILGVQSAIFAVSIIVIALGAYFVARNNKQPYTKI